MTHLQVPDQLAEKIQAEAKAEGLTVHELLQRMLREHRTLKRSLKTLSAAEITAQLDALYANISSSLDPALLRLQGLSLEREAW
jgi:flagellin-specific chaperone FliS